MAATLNPWERLAAKVPSAFASDLRFTGKKLVTNTSDNPANPKLGALSASGEEGYLKRVAVPKNNITIGKRYQGEIPQAMRSKKTEGVVKP
jgi:hypothetical protein